MFAGDARLMQLTAAVTRVTQDTAPAVAWACAGAAVLERVLLGQGAAAAVKETMQELRQEGAGKYIGMIVGGSAGGHKHMGLTSRSRYDIGVCVCVCVF
jgi:hypothetical protein